MRHCKRAPYRNQQSNEEERICARAGVKASRIACCASSRHRTSLAVSTRHRWSAQPAQARVPRRCASPPQPSRIGPFELLAPSSPSLIDPFRFSWLMCDIHFCISWPEKSQDAYRASRSIPFRLVDVRYPLLYFLARRITRCNIAHSVQLVDVRYPLLYFLARKITRCISNISIHSVSVGRCAIFGFVFPAMWETTFPRNTQAGFVRTLRPYPILNSMLD